METRVSPGGVTYKYCFFCLIEMNLLFICFALLTDFFVLPFLFV